MKSLKSCVLFSTVAFSLSLSSAFAQDADFVPFSKGTKEVSFAMNAMSQQRKGSDIVSSQAVIEFSYGYFLTNNLKVAVDLSSGAQIDEDNDSGDKDTYSQATIGISAAYYFKIGARSAIYPELLFNAGSIKSEFSSGNTYETDIKGTFVGVGYASMMNKNVGWGVKYRMGRNTFEDENSSMDFDMSYLLAGLQIYF